MSISVRTTGFPERKLKGDENLQRAEPVVSATDGTFNPDGQKSVVLFRDLAWFSVETSAHHRDYEWFSTNYTPRLAATSRMGDTATVA